MFSVTVRDHLMVAHSFTGEMFGPAQALHGATFVVDATFRAPHLDSNGVVIDIGLASSVLHDILAALNYRNLDDVPAFAGTNTTTEVLAAHVADALADQIHLGLVGDAATRVVSLSITLHESHVAWATYERAL